MITVESEPAHGLQADLMQHLLTKDQLHQRELRQVCLDGIPRALMEYHVLHLISARRPASPAVLLISLGLLI